MSRFFETIQVLDGELKNLEFHQERFEQTRSLALGMKRHPHLADVVRIPTGLDLGPYKCRISYHKDITLIEFEPQQAHQVQSLQLVFSDTIDYRFKYADRSKLESLFRQRAGCDDILVVKNACITDTFFANIVFWDGNEWVTPDTPLLPGTMRASLLKKGLIREDRVAPEDLDGYQKLKLINAMNDLEHAPELKIESIKK